VTNQAYDQWHSAATFFVADVPTIRGAANLHPVITSCVIGEAEPVATTVGIAG
jgi:hypothetical protein